MRIELTNDRGRQLSDALAFAILVKARDSDGKLIPFTWLSILNEINPSKAAEVRGILDTFSSKGN